MGFGSFNLSGNSINLLLGQSDLQRGHKLALEWSISFSVFCFMSMFMSVMSIGLGILSSSVITDVMTTFSSGSDLV